MAVSKIKWAALLVAGVLTLAGGVLGLGYYLDYVRPPELSPRRVVEQYFEAISLEDYKNAYSMVSLQHYHESFNQFVDRVSMYSPEMRLKIQKESIEKNNAVVEAEVSVPMLFGLYEAEVRMDLVRARREWKILHP